MARFLPGVGRRESHTPARRNVFRMERFRRPVHVLDGERRYRRQSTRHSRPGPGQNRVRSVRPPVRTEKVRAKRCDPVRSLSERRPQTDRTCDEPDCQWIVCSGKEREIDGNCRHLPFGRDAIERVAD